MFLKVYAEFRKMSNEVLSQFFDEHDETLHNYSII